ncbi:MAG TPA: LacI family DNA-binding transcriptional regulator, partial [Anaerovoracaceae bacterium]|nr:LacI family DNA-binding transcriptional regulator [Anaerovoracaceae bacterium]
ISYISEYYELLYMKGYIQMTLKEIAALAGVSISTVSRIINSPDDSFARKEVRDRVWAIIKETGYVPNQSARELKLKQNSSASVSSYTLTCLLGRTKTLDDNPFFAQVARAVEQQALNLGCSVSHLYSIFDIHNNADQNFPKTDGAVVLGRFSSEAMNFIEKHYRNKVYVGRNVMDCDWDQVICDGYDATKIALEHLIFNGHKRIGYIGESVNEVRYQAFSDMVVKHGLDQDANLVCRCQQNGDGGYMGADKMIKQATPLPTAVFCATDIAAIAAIRRFSEAGIRIPNQLSVISMDNIELSAYVSPMLTTVETPIVELGNVAVQTLIDRINKRHRLPMKIFLPNKLMVRESVAKCSAST